jgi:hypothetical protein
LIKEKVITKDQTSIQDSGTVITNFRDSEPIKKEENGLIKEKEITKYQDSQGR